jgi:hypothetical protein
MPRGGVSGGGSGGYGGGGGGGAAGPTPQAEALLNADGIFRLIAGGAFAPQTITTDQAIYDDLRRQLGEGVAADRATAGASYDGLDQYLGGYVNAYNSTPQNQTLTQDPRYAALMNQQGGDVAQYQQAVTQQNAEGAQLGGGFADLISTLARAEDSSANSRRAESQMARTYANDSIAAQERAMNMGIGVREADARRQDQLTNAQLAQAARQQQLAALMPVLQMLAAAGLNMPTLEQMGLA